MKFQGTTVLVTGAGSGIGRAIALAFAREGAHVLAADIDPDAAAETARLAGPRTVPHQVDVSDSASVQAMIAACLDRFGRLDVLVNNAGIGIAARVTETSEADWDRIMAVNARGVFLGCKYAIPAMVRQGGGVILNMASVAGLVGVRDRAAYCAAKGAVIALTRAIAVDHARENIRVVAICPGTVETPWVARINAHLGDYETIRAQMNARQLLGRMGTPEEIAAACLYLASPEAAFVHGSCFVIDGGMTAQ